MPAQHMYQIRVFIVGPIGLGNYMCYCVFVVFELVLSQLKINALPQIYSPLFYFSSVIYI